MDLDRSRRGDELVLEVRGEIDAHSSPILRQALHDVSSAGAAYVVVDLTRVRFMDSTGTRVLSQAHTSMAARGGELRVMVGSERILELLCLTGMAHMVDPRSAERVAQASEGGSYRSGMLAARTIRA